MLTVELLSMLIWSESQSTSFKVKVPHYNFHDLSQKYQHLVCLLECHLLFQGEKWLIRASYYYDTCCHMVHKFSQLILNCLCDARYQNEVKLIVSICLFFCRCEKKCDFVSTKTCRN